MDIADLIEIIELLLVVVALFLIHRSVPANKVSELIDKVDRAAEKTPTKLDDLLVEVAQILNDLRDRTPSDDTHLSDTTD